MNAGPAGAAVEFVQKYGIFVLDAGVITNRLFQPLKEALVGSMMGSPRS